MTDKMEQAFLDGTHPALTRDAQAASTLRQQPLASEQEDNHSQHSDGGGEQDTPPTPQPHPPLRETTNARTQPSQPAARRRGEESRNTGVKGVKADYAEAMARQQRQQQQPQQQPQLARSLERNLKLNDDEGEDELALVRRKRLAELQGSGERRAAAAAGHARSFGHLSEVGVEGFVAAVEDEDPETAVVVHLYEPEIPTCALLNSHLASLARLHPSTKFLRALASELDFMQPTDDTSSYSIEADNATLPTVLVYRAGELETTWVRFDFELPGGQLAQGEQGKRHVEEVLYNAGVISSLTSAAGGAAASGPRTIRRTTQDSDGDDDDDD